MKGIHYHHLASGLFCHKPMDVNVWLHKRNGTLSVWPSSHNRFKCLIGESGINELVCRRLWIDVFGVCQRCDNGTLLLGTWRGRGCSIQAGFPRLFCRWRFPSPPLPFKMSFQGFFRVEYLLTVIHFLNIFLIPRIKWHYYLTNMILFGIVINHTCLWQNEIVNSRESEQGSGPRFS